MEQRLDHIEYALQRLWDLLAADHRLEAKVGRLTGEAHALRAVLADLSETKTELRTVAAGVRSGATARARLWRTLAGVVAGVLLVGGVGWRSVVETRQDARRAADLARSQCNDENAYLAVSITREVTLAERSAPLERPAHVESVAGYRSAVRDCDGAYPR